MPKLNCKFGKILAWQRIFHFSSLRVKLILACQEMLNELKWTLNELKWKILSSNPHYPQAYTANFQTWKVLYAKQPTPQQKSCQVRGYLYCFHGN